jgi:hypothetical protein
MYDTDVYDCGKKELKFLEWAVFENHNEVTAQFREFCHNVRHFESFVGSKELIISQKSAHSIHKQI